MVKGFGTLCYSIVKKLTIRILNLKIKMRIRSCPPEENAPKQAGPVKYGQSESLAPFHRVGVISQGRPKAIVASRAP
jgi:hypothetical protein